MNLTVILFSVFDVKLRHGISVASWAQLLPASCRTAIVDEKEPDSSDAPFVFLLYPDVRMNSWVPLSQAPVAADLPTANAMAKVFNDKRPAIAAAGASATSLQQFASHVLSAMDIFPEQWYSGSVNCIFSAIFSQVFMFIVFISPATVGDCC